MPNVINYNLDAATLPDADDLFTELEEVYSEVERIRNAVEDIFNESDTRRILHGFIVPHKTDLRIDWNGAKAIIKIG